MNSNNFHAGKYLTTTVVLIDQINHTKIRTQYNL